MGTMIDLWALLIVGMVVFMNVHARLVRNTWPPGHPWCSLMFLLLSAGFLFQGNPPTRGRIVPTLTCNVLAVLSSILWLRSSQSKRQSD
jgi:hypothetical protein